MKPTLVVLAAGMGSRYGGLKQVDPVGPSGETLLDSRPTPEDVAGAVVYLLSAKSVTGAVIPVDSGQSLLANSPS